MKLGVCSKCQSKTVFTSPKKVSTGIGALFISHFSRALLTNYVCTTCGYVESYVDDSKKLQEIENKFIRVGASKNDIK